MPKAKNTTPVWVRNLRRLMEQQGLNPRSLSLKAGLNATAVRDMLEGRTKFPRYDTARALAAALGTTPVRLMGDDGATAKMAQKGEAFAEDLELLTEIIARLQEVVAESKQELSPRKFAAMAATLYRRLRAGEAKKNLSALGPQIHDLLDYDTLRRKRA